MKNAIITTCCVVSSIIIGYSQSTQSQNKELTEDRKKAIYDSLNNVSPEASKAEFLKNHSRKPRQMDSLKQSAPSDGFKKKEGADLKLNRAPQAVRKDAKFPGEFEEMQGVFISWQYNAGVLDTTAGNGVPKMFRKLATAIQDAGAKVYINIHDSSDSSICKKYMTSNGTPLKNYMFLMNQGDAIWARDFGPVNYYYSNNDSIGWLDLKYYPGRDLDNDLPKLWAQKLGIPITYSPLFFEGGNVLQDGYQTLLTSSKIYEGNFSYSKQQVRDSLNASFNLKQNYVLKYLPYDGGTGHIDLYIDMMDENSFIHTEYPSYMSTIPSFPDYDSVKFNINFLKAQTSINNKPYRFNTIPLPTKDDGLNYADGNDYQKYTRTYSNHLILNKSILQPVFSDEKSGNKKGDSLAIVAIKKAYPGYTIIPIDMRSLDGSGGSLHCITKEFVAENPVRFKHYPYRDLENYQANFPIDVAITNKSGIAKATLYWRKKGSSTWTVVNLQKDTANHWTGKIPAPSSPTGGMDTLQYYISGTSNNGKTITRPMPGPDGAYTFWYKSVITVGLSDKSHFTEVGNLYPNPTLTSSKLEINCLQSADITLSIVDLYGRILSEKKYDKLTGQNNLDVYPYNLASGIYYVRLANNNKVIGNFKWIYTGEK